MGRVGAAGDNAVMESFFAPQQLEVPLYVDDFYARLGNCTR